MNEANQSNKQSGLYDEEFAKASRVAQGPYTPTHSGYPAGVMLQQNTMTPTPGNYDVSTKVSLEIPSPQNRANAYASAQAGYHAGAGLGSAILPEHQKIMEAAQQQAAAKYEAREAAEKSSRVRAVALELALRHAHAGAVTAEVIRVAREFEAYLTGTDTTAKLP